MALPTLAASSLTITLDKLAKALDAGYHHKAPPGKTTVTKVFRTKCFL